MMIDSHAHLNFKQFAKDQKEVIQKTLNNDTWIINVGSQFSTSKRAVEIANQYPKGVYAAVGLHPIHLEDQIYEDKINGEKVKFRTRAEKFNINKYKELAKNKKVIALGETGFDFYRINQKNKKIIIKKQAYNLEQHLNLAYELNLPLIFHCRDAYDEMLKFLQNYNKTFFGVLHCYAGNISQAKKFLELGLYLGFTGIVTFKNALQIQEVAKQVPLERMLIETDCPYLTPEPFRGKRNEPLYVKYVAKKIAELKQISPDEVIEHTFKNAQKLFNI